MRLPTTLPSVDLSNSKILEVPVEDQNQSRRFNRRSLIPSNSHTIWQIEYGVVRTLTWFEDGTVATLGIWGTDDLVGSALSNTNPYEIECLTEVKAKLLPPHQLPEVTTALLRHIRQTDEFVKILHCRQTETALLMLLNWLARKFGRLQERDELNNGTEVGHIIDLRLTHQELADIIGTTRVTITRILNNFERQGVIRRHYHQLIVLPEQQPFWHYEI